MITLDQSEALDKCSYDAINDNQVTATHYNKIKFYVEQKHVILYIFCILIPC